MTEPAGGGAAVRRLSPPPHGMFALPAAAGIEASDHRSYRVRGDLLNPNARLFLIDNPPGRGTPDVVSGARPYRGYDGVAWLDMEGDGAGLLDGAIDRKSAAFWIR